MAIKALILGLLMSPAYGDVSFQLIERSNIADEDTFQVGSWEGIQVSYHEDELPHPSIAEYVQYAAETVVDGCSQRGIPLPHLHLEPGRSLVARAGVALYRVGTIKRTPTRRWILVDGGLADNPRFALYQARYSALPVVEPTRPNVDAAWRLLRREAGKSTPLTSTPSRRLAPTVWT